MKTKKTLLRGDDDDDDDADDADDDDGFYDDAVWQLASVSDEKQAAAVHCASPMPRFI